MKKTRKQKKIKIDTRRRMYEVWRDKKRKQYHEQLKELNELKETSKINMNELISDIRYFKENLFTKIKLKFSKIQFCWVTVHLPGNVDIVRRFPMPKPFVLDINNKYYLFTPKAFRYVNDTAHLYFYHGVPFAILHMPTENFKPPSLDADAFSSVQRSKFIQDAVAGEQDMPKGIMIAVIVITALILVMTIINMSQIFQLMKTLGGV